MRENLLKMDELEVPGTPISGNQYIELMNTESADILKRHFSCLPLIERVLHTYCNHSFEGAHRMLENVHGWQVGFNSRSKLQVLHHFLWTESTDVSVATRIGRTCAD